MSQSRPENPKWNSGALPERCHPFAGRNCRVKTSVARVDRHDCELGQLRNLEWTKTRSGVTEDSQVVTGSLRSARLRNDSVSARHDHCGASSESEEPVAPPRDRREQATSLRRLQWSSRCEDRWRNCEEETSHRVAPGCGRDALLKA